MLILLGSCLFLIPFYNLLGNDIGIYSYAYIIFLLLVSFQLTIFVTTFKVTSKYQELGHYRSKRLFLKMGSKSFLILGLILVGILLILSSWLAQFILKYNPSDVRDLTSGFKILSLAVSFLPLIGFYQGYLLGHRLKNVVVSSFIIQVLSGIAFILTGGFVSLYKYSASISSINLLSILGLGISSIITFIYLLFTFRQSRKTLEKEMMKVDEKEVSSSSIKNKFMKSLFPGVLIPLFYICIYFIDIINLGNMLNNHTDDVSYISGVVGNYSLWGFHLNIALIILLVYLIFRGIKFTKNNIKDLLPIFIQRLFLFVLTGIFIASFISYPLFTILYSYAPIGGEFYSYYVFLVGVCVLFISISYILLKLGKVRKLMSYFLLSFIIKMLFNLPLISTFTHLGYPAYYGFITSSIVSSLIFTFISLYYIGKKYQINYEKVIPNIINNVIMIFVFAIFTFLFKLVLPFSIDSKIINILLISVYLILIGVIFYIFTFKNRQTYGIPIIRDVKRKVVKR